MKYMFTDMFVVFAVIQQVFQYTQYYTVISGEWLFAACSFVFLYVLITARCIYTVLASL